MVTEHLHQCAAPPPVQFDTAPRPADLATMAREPGGASSDAALVRRLLGLEQQLLQQLSNTGATSAAPSHLHLKRGYCLHNSCQTTVQYLPAEILAWNAMLFD